MSAGPPPAEALLTCPVCQRGITAADYDRHLRREHDLVVYRGVRRPTAETLDAIRFDLLAKPPSDPAWQAVQRLARDESRQPAKWLAGWLTECLNRVPELQRGSVMSRLVPLIAPGHDDLIARLAGRPELIARRFALMVVARLACVPPSLVKPVKCLLTDRTADKTQQARVVTATLKQPTAGPLAARMVRWFIAKLNRKNALRRLRALEARTGPHPLINAALGRLTHPRRLTCPRCRVILQRDEMQAHLWMQHRLLLEAFAIREPWDVIDQWIDRYRTTGEVVWLERCRTAAAKLDTEGGSAQLDRRILARGVADPVLLKNLLARAKAEHAGCCPFCYALVPVPRETPPLWVNLRSGRLSAAGYEIETDERGITTRLKIVTPRRVIYAGPEPAQRYTPMGRVIRYAGPFIALAVLTALAWPWNPLPLVLILLNMGVLFGLIGWLLGRFAKSAEQRALEYAWSLLVPQLHSNGFDPEDSRFLAGLAQRSSEQEYNDIPEAPLRNVLYLTLEALEQRRAAPLHLAALCRLSAEVTAARGADPVALIERWTALAFEGRVPLAFVQHLFDDWQADFWTPAQLARLRLRLLDRAFEAGFEVRGLIDAGHYAPALGAALGIDQPRRLAALRLLWSSRASRPWDRFGEVKTAFELASSPMWTPLLERSADLLLWHRDTNTRLAVSDEEPTPAEVWMTSDAVWIADEEFVAPPLVFEVRRRQRGTELRMGGVGFRSPDDLDKLTRTLERWFRFAFNEFFPQIDKAGEWVSPVRAAHFRAWGATTCISCERFFLPRVGEVGVGMEEPGR